MTNHVHWIVLPHVQTAMANTFRRAHSRFSAHMNRQHKRANGHLWQGRYYSCPLDDSHFAAALLYVERNPVRAGLAQSPCDYPWSSAAARVGQAPAPPYLRLNLWTRSFSTEDWARLLTDDPEPETEEQLRASTKQGKPYGKAAFIEQVELQTGRILRVRNAGRPGSPLQPQWPSKSPITAVAEFGCVSGLRSLTRPHRDA